MGNKIIFFDIDTQRDFMLPDGALYVPGAEEIIPLLKRITEFASEEKNLLISSADAHKKDDPEFCDFPPHCVKGTPGQEKIAETLTENRIILDLQAQPNLDPDKYQQIIIEKQVFDVFSNPNTDIILTRVNPEQIFVYGVATDYCVKSAVLSTLARGYNVTVIEDVIRAVDKKSGEAAISEMKKSGAKFINSSELFLKK